MTGSPRVDCCDGVEARRKRRNLPLPLWRTAARAYSLHVRADDGAVGKDLSMATRAEKKK